MRITQKVTGRSMTIAGGVGVGVLLSVTLTVVGSAILAGIINGEIIKENGLGYGAIVILLISSIVGALAAWKCVRHRRLLVCSLTGAGYYAALLGLTGLFFGGQYHGMGVTALVVLAGTGCTMLLGLKSKKTGNYSFKKMLYR